MQKLNDFSIKRLTLSGFKCFNTETCFDFGGTTFVTGRNGSGKSSIADAIAFAVTGQPFFGDRSSDRLGNPATGTISVEMLYSDESGVPHTLNRQRKGSRMSVSLDGYNVRQVDLSEIFGERDVFLSMFNPLYFIEVLAEDGKTLLEKLLPVIPHERVLAELSDHTRALLENEKMLSAETCLQNCREEIRDLEKTLVYLQGQSDLLERQERDRLASLSEAQTKLAAITAELTELETARDNGRDPDTNQKRMAALHEQAIQSQQIKPQPQSTHDLERKIHDAELTLEKRRLSAYASQYTQTIAEIEVELKLLYTNHARVSKIATETSAGTKCPTCLRAVTDDNVEAVRLEIRSGLPEIVARGKELKEQLTEIRELDDKAKQIFMQFQADDIAMLEADLSSLREELQDITAANAFAEDEYNEACWRIEAEINQLEADMICGALSFEQMERYRGLCIVKQETDEKIKALSGSAPVDDANGKILSISNTIQSKKALVAGLVEYIAKRAELTLAGLKMNRVSISLFDVVKTTGEVKDTFKFTYDGRHYRWLSLSEKIRAGLEVAELIKSLTGRRYPTFIDNGESVCAVDNVKPSGQIIFARVVSGADLSVSARERQSAPRAA